MQELGLTNLATRPTVRYKIHCLMPPLSGVFLATCMCNLLLQINVDTPMYHDAHMQNFHATSTTKIENIVIHCTWHQCGCASCTGSPSGRNPNLWHEGVNRAFW